MAPDRNSIVQVARTSGGINVLIRKPGTGDQGYVASTWVESLSKADHNANRAGLGFLVDQMLDHEGVRVLVACEPGAQTVILGWLCWSPVKAVRLVHYAYVRATMRNRGIASALLNEAGIADADRTLTWTMKGPSAHALMQKFPHAVETPLKEFLSP